MAASNDRNDPGYREAGHQDQQTSVSPEQFALGAIALYALNFGCLTIFVVITPFALFIAGVLLQKFGVVPATTPTIGDFGSLISSIAAFVCLILAITVGYFFYWGAKSILRGAIISTAIFLTIISMLHGAWALRFGLALEPINWFGALIGFFSILVIIFRWKRPFPRQ